MELIVNEFLDDYFFQKEEMKSKWVESNDSRQLKGIDVYITSDKHSLNEAKVDIKSAVKSSTYYLPTFALELSSLDKTGRERIGWFINDNLETEYYLLVYPRSQKFYTEMELKTDIDYADYYLVRKDDLRNYFLSKGYDCARLKKISDEMREEKKESGVVKLTRESDCDDFKFVLSGHLKEQPVNVVVKRRVYNRLAVLQGRVEKDGIH